MGKPFQKVHASMVGKFEDGVGEKIPQWIRANGGQFSRDVNSRTTHLIATKEAFKINAIPGILIAIECFKDLETNQQNTVENAKKLSAVKIVSYDWLEDSLLSNNRRPKPEGPYLLNNLMKPERKEVQKKKVIPTSSKVAKETKGNIPKRRIGISFPGLHFIVTMQTVLTCHVLPLQLILSSPQRAKKSVSMILISRGIFRCNTYPSQPCVRCTRTERQTWFTASPCSAHRNHRSPAEKSTN